MAGRPGRSGGWNKLSPEDHAMRGTRARPRTRPATVKAVTTPTTDEIPPVVVAGLQEPGRAFAEGAWRDYAGWSGAELMLLRQAARTLDDAEAATTPRFRQGAIRLFAALVAQLRLEPAGPAKEPSPLDKYINRPSKWAGVLR